MTGFGSTSMRQLAMLTLLPAFLIMIVGCPNVVTDPPPGQTVDTDGDGVVDDDDMCPDTPANSSVNSVGCVVVVVDVVLQVAIEPVNSGTVTQTADGNVVTITAVPADGWIFDTWFGTIVTSQNPLTILADDATTIIARFSEPPPPDADGDGVPDSEDKCAEFDDSEDRDDDGLPDDCDDCPDDKTNDSDDDGVCDGADKCPGEDDKQDADGDKVPDACDNCPDDPNKVEPGDCGCGVVEGSCQECFNDSDCNDGIACTSNNCNTTTNECFYIALDSSCDNNLWCDGVETCDAIFGCQSGTAVDCTDTDDCTIDTCVEATDSCSNVDNPADSDADGTIDCFDGCPNDPDKIVEGVCGCGISDNDGDSDGVADCNDNCPGISNPLQVDADLDDFGDVCDNCPDDLNTDQADADSDNVGDVCDGCASDPVKTEPGICGCNVAEDMTDTDSDGTIDCVDGCVDDPNKTESGVCGCGVSDIDSDSDGVEDCNDSCSNDPDKIEPGVCGCNVEEDDTDTDSDGTVDCIDGCVDDPNKIDPGDCGCGVPDDDTDGDGLGFCVDPCPNDPDNDSDNDGFCADDDDCPDTPKGVSFDENGCPTGPPRWESSRVLTFDQFTPDTYNFTEGNVLIKAEVKWDTDFIEDNLFSTIVPGSLVSEIPLGVETLVYELENVFGQPNDTANRKMTIDVFSYVIDGTTATWTFDYTVVDTTVSEIFGTQVISKQFTGSMTGEIAESQALITYTILDAELTQCNATCDPPIQLNPDGFGTVIWTLVP